MNVQTHKLDELGDYSFVVIFAKYGDTWAMVRHTDRVTWEIPGGRLEQGETPLEAAKRELYEETGAKDFNINPMFDYSVTINGNSSNGQVFLAEVMHFDALPESEIAEMKLVDVMPVLDEMTYPAIQPLLFKMIVSFTH